MSTRGQFNTKNPTIKRILKEAAELANNASADFHATPLEDNLFEWHFTLRGAPEPSPYANGIYHGRIVLPSAYPHRPPSFRFLTPSGRFEVNREICLSISGFHEETWQPAWGIRTALVAIRSFMDTGAAGQVGGLECDEASRKKLAEQSRSWKCPSCASSNEEIIKEREELVAGSEDQGTKGEETVPEELRLAYREDLGGSSPNTDTKGKYKATTEASAQTAATPTDTTNNAPQNPTPPQSVARTAPARQAPQPTRTIPPVVTHQQPPRNANEGSPAWIDHAIYAIAIALAVLILRKVF